MLPEYLSVLRPHQLLYKMSFFSRVFRSRDASGSKKQGKQNGVSQDIPQKPQQIDAFIRTEVTPDEVQELLHGCTVELKSRGLYIRPPMKKKAV